MIQTTQIRNHIFVIIVSISGWNQAWGYVLGLMLDSKRIERSQIGVDVFKNLSQGQAVLIDKASHREDLFQVWKLAL